MSFYIKYTKKHDIKPIGFDPWKTTESPFNTPFENKKIDTEKNAPVVN